MKLAQIILPKQTNIQMGCGDTTLYYAHNQLELDLAKKWGGYTAYEAKGFWQDPEGNGHFEMVVVYQVAMERADVIHLRELAAETCAAAKQQCVMIVTPNGDVEFIKPKEKVDGSVRPV